MEKVHGGVVEFDEVKVGGGRSVLPSHCNAKNLEEELGVELKVIVA